MAAQELDTNYYDRLGVIPSASPQEIRRAYRERSKLYHPDTTELSAAIATEKFQQLNEAYATLSSPERRAAYDLKIGYSRVAVIQPMPTLHTQQHRPWKPKSSAYLDPSDRPLSAGEIFALFILGITFVACLLLVCFIGLTRSEYALQGFNSPLLQKILHSSLEQSSIEQSSTEQAALSPLLPETSPDVLLESPVSKATPEALPEAPSPDVIAPPSLPETLIDPSVEVSQPLIPFAPQETTD